MPELILLHILFPILPLLFPEHVVVGVHAGLEGQRLRHVGEDRMLANHRILIDPRHEVPPPPGVLAVIEDILSYHSDIAVGEKGAEQADELCFFSQTPIAFSPLCAHEREAEGIEIRPRDPCASNMSRTSFNIEADSQWTRSHLCSSDKASEESFSLIVVWSKDEAAEGNRIRRFISKAGSSAKIVNCDSSPIPLAENSCWVISRDALWLEGNVGEEHTSPPFRDSPTASESPHR